MNDTQIQDPIPAAAPGPFVDSSHDEQPVTPREGLKHRVLGMRAVAAVAVAALLLGGAGGLALGALSNGSDTQQGPGRGGFPGGQNVQPGQGFPGQQGGTTQQDGTSQQDGTDPFQQGQLPDGFQPGQAPGPGGGMPPGTAPQDDVQPDAGTDDTTGDTNT